jgi:hypothetical protein
MTLIVNLTRKAIMFKDELIEIGFIIGLGFRFVLYITSEQPRVSTAGFFLIILFYFILFTEAQQ